MRFFDFIGRVFRVEKPERLEVRCVPWLEADRILKSDDGLNWRIAKEEDDNHVLGMVYLERIKKL